MKDSQQKERLCRHFSAQGWFVLIEVPVFFGQGHSGAEKLITDIDVFAVRAGTDLRWELVLGDCKTLKGQSPANRVLWLRGLMDYFGATTGVIILQRSRGSEIEPDHKLFASRHDIVLLDEREFERFDSALNFPAGSKLCGYGAEEINKFKDSIKRFDKIGGFAAYISGGAWNQRDYTLMLRGVIGEGRSVSREIDPKKREHLSLVVEGAAVFSIALASCVGRVFNQYLLPETERELDNALKAVIWGGRENYDFIAKLRGELLRAKGAGESESGDLSLPRWNDFVQLVRSLLEHPKLGFLAPSGLRIASLDLFNDVPFLSAYGSSELSLLKFMMLVVKYYCRACDFPAETSEALVSKFAKRQSDIVHENAAALGRKADVPPDVPKRPS